MADKTGYLGRSPADSTTVIARQSFSVGITTDSFSFNSGYTPGYVDVYINGVKLIDVSDFSATDGSNITLLTAANNGDVVEVVAYKAFNIGSISDTPGNFNVGNVLTAQSGSVTGNFTVGGVLTYEDVNNVDSIGVVTARTGVDVLAGGVDITGGGLKVVGVTSLTGNTVVSNSADVTISSGSSVTTAEHFYFNDGKKANFGNDSDLQIYHNDTSGYIDNNKGALYIRNNVDGDDGSNIIIQAKSGEAAAVFQDDEGVRLYYDGVEKFRTTGAGVDVTGITTSDGFYATGVGVGTALFVEGDARVTGILTVGTASISIDGNVAYPTIRPTLDLNFAASKTLDRRIIFTRDSIGTYTDDLGTVKYASNNVPRFDHNPTTGESLGLLIEESRTNLVEYGDFTTGWTEYGGAATSTTETTAPDGTLTAKKITSKGDQSTSGIYDSINYTANQTYTHTMWLKAGTVTIAGITVHTPGNWASSDFPFITVNLSTGAVTASGGVSAKTTEYPNGWYRLEATGTFGGSTTVDAIWVHSQTGSSMSGNTTDYYYVWGPQAEQGYFATSYIPTTGTTATRSADIAKITGTNFTDFYNQTEGTVFSSHKQYSNIPNTQNTYIYQVGDDTSSQVAFRLIDKNTYYGDPSKLTATQWPNDVALQKPTATSGEKIKTAFACKLNDAAVSYDGATVLTDTSLDMNAGQTMLSIGCYPHTPQAFLNGHIQQLSYYNKRLPNAQLKSLTLS